MNKRQKAAKQTKQKIINAVKALSLTKAYDEMSIDEITQAAGVAKGTFYVHFKRREDVCAEIAYENFQQLADSLPEQHIPNTEKIAYFIRKSMDIVEHNTLEVTQQWFKSVIAPASHEWLGSRKLHFDLEVIEKCLKEAIKQGELSIAISPHELAKIIISSFYGSIILWCMSNGKIHCRQIIDEFCLHVLPTLLKTGDSV